MSSVTKRIHEISQPRGGYVKLEQFTLKSFNDDKELYEENLPPQLIGLVVDYLTRFMLTKDVLRAFSISFQGYEFRIMWLGEDQRKHDKLKGVSIDSLLSKVKGLDDESIIAACKACSYDVWRRATPILALTAPLASDIFPDKSTINNIRVMVNRSISFLENNGPLVKVGPTFEPGYSKIVNTGDGDYLTEDCIWDFKVSKNKPNKEHTLQLLMYWILGQHSNREEFSCVNKIGIYNPRLNQAYILNIENISKETISIVEKDVICY
ncbi:MAG: hypothetical protein IJZ73_06765 [Clostridia bacterium]|nr:hypothetical protein [Clostridia bacterium]